MEKLQGSFKETEELIAIIAKSIETAKNNKTVNKLNIESWTLKILKNGNGNFK